MIVFGALGVFRKRLSKENVGFGCFRLLSASLCVTYDVVISKSKTYYVMTILCFKTSYVLTIL